MEPYGIKVVNWDVEEGGLPSEEQYEKFKPQENPFLFMTLTVKGEEGSGRSSYDSIMEYVRAAEKVTPEDLPRYILRLQQHSLQALSHRVCRAVARARMEKEAE